MYPENIDHLGRERVVAAFTDIQLSFKPFNGAIQKEKEAIGIYFFHLFTPLVTKDIHRAVYSCKNIKRVRPN